MNFSSFALALLFSQLLDFSTANSCACEAEELGFAIDCTDSAAMLTAFNALQSNSCATDCSSSDCVRNYYIVQSHHDYCIESQVPREIENGFHDFDPTCAACDIQRMFVEGAPDCPVAVCDDGSGNAAYSALLDEGCLTDCSSETCGTNFLTLLAVHDNCPGEALTNAAERGFHSMEDACTMHVCNSGDAGASHLECDEHDHDHGDDHDHDHEDEPAPAASPVAAPTSGVNGRAAAGSFALITLAAML